MTSNARKPAPKGKASRSGSNRNGRSRPAGPPDKPLLTTDQGLDLLGFVLIAVAVGTVLSALSPEQGDVTGGWLRILRSAFGWGLFLAPIIMGLIGFYLVVRRFGDRFPQLSLVRLIGTGVVSIAALITLQMAGAVSQPDRAALLAAGGGGGTVGAGLLDMLSQALGNFGAVVALIILWLVAFMLITKVSVAQVVDDLRSRFSQPAGSAPGGGVIVPGYDRSPERGRSTMGDLIINGLKPRRPGRRSAPVEPDPEEAPPPRPIASTVPPAAVPANPARGRASIPLTPPSEPSRRLPPPRIIGGGEPGAAPAPVSSPPPAAEAPPAYAAYSARVERHDWALPAMDNLLEPGKDASMKEADIRQRALVIEETLRAFGVPGRVVEVNRGPTITQYGVEPGFVDMKGGKQVKVKVSRIAGLADDLALALSAPRIRIEAPVPGKAVVGIEVPNSEVSVVSLRDVMESEEFERLARKTRLRLGLGQDVSGHPVVADMTAMPHLLIAGTTGSGKSVCVNAIITALLCYNSPEDLRFLMVDPKRVELTGYNGIPHLISPVVVDLEKVTGVLQWVTREMESRYRMFARHGVRNILDFNAKAAERTPAAHADAAGLVASSVDDLKKIPYIVVIIDELADLMMLAPDETEKTLCRLAQMARATGIHLVIATQRPSVDVVTGLIKANFPARIAFTVATSIDSRVILDTPGAEKLLGRGDLLVVTPENPLPTRAQGCWVSDKEINRVVRHWRGQAGGEEAAPDPVAAALSAPSAPMAGTLDGAAQVVQMPLPSAGEPLSWDESRALASALEDTGPTREDRLFQDAVATVRLQGKASISLLQRRLRIGYTRSARLIEQMEERGIVGPSMAGSQFREVLPPSASAGGEAQG